MHAPPYLPTYLPTYQPTYLSIYLPAYLPISLIIPAYLPLSIQKEEEIAVLLLLQMTAALMFLECWKLEVAEKVLLWCCSTK
jgi:hypothetical protein